MGGYRDDLGAAQARVDALERRVAELEAENRALRARDDASEPAWSSLRRRKAAMLAITTALSAGMVGIGLIVGGSVLQVAVVISAVVLGSASVVAWLFVKPADGEVVVLSRRTLRLAGGQNIGYRLLLDHGALRYPIVEKVHRLSLAPIAVELDVVNAYTETGATVGLRGRAVVRLLGHASAVSDAIGRFLGRPMSDIARVAGETVEGYLRGLVAEMTVDELENQPAAVADRVMEFARWDLERLGLVVDTLELSVVPSKS